ncbi:hypothetical protein ACGFKZ_29505 [Micromonospora tulbaghiae]|uniref:hypothetical protein n=1 Tax=Micromonospora tulbaghiae TaxID=479978 RepID=UPI00371C1156
MTMTAETAAAQIRRAYDLAGGRDWVAIVRLAEFVDLTPDQMAAGVVHLARTDQQVTIAPESNQKTITPMGHLYAVRYGAQANHLIRWD